MFGLAQSSSGWRAARPVAPGNRILYCQLQRHGAVRGRLSWHVSC